MDGAFKNKKVLFVEDDEANRYYTQLILEDIGCAFELVSNGQEAVDKLKASKFNIVFTDLRMPVLDGFNLVRIIREKIDKDLVIVAVTANVHHDIADQCAANGMNGFIAKGSDVKEFINELTQWIAKS